MIILIPSIARPTQLTPPLSARHARHPAAEPSTGEGRKTLPCEQLTYSDPVLLPTLRKTWLTEQMAIPSPAGEEARQYHTLVYGCSIDDHLI
jgi:hypothetical protein